MEVASDERVAFAGSHDGGYIWPDFLPAYDGTATLAKLLDLLAATGRSLSSVVQASCRACTSCTSRCRRRGSRRARSCASSSSARQASDLVLVDGVKVLRADGWVLVLPDPELAVTHVWAEAESDQAARQVAQEYARAIRQALR